MSDEGDPLRDIALLRDLAPEERRRLGQRCSWPAFARNETIVDRDEVDRSLFFCIAGAVEVTTFSTSGRAVSFARLGPGSYFGELSAIDGAARSATAIAASDVQLGRLPPDALERLVAENPKIAWRMLETLAGVVRALNDRVIDLNTRTVQQRVIRELLHGARPSPVAEGQWIVEPAPTQATLASRADTTRETAGRVLSELYEDGLVTRKGRCLTLHDPERLQTLLENLAT